MKECINDVVLQTLNPHLPFGGVGNSGMGQYHGKEGFMAFSHKKAILHQSRFVDAAGQPFAGGGKTGSTVKYAGKLIVPHHNADTQ